MRFARSILQSVRKGGRNQKNAENPKIVARAI